MKVLALSQWYDPEPAPRVHGLCKELVTRGHEVTAITSVPNYPLGRTYPGYRMRWRQWEVRDGVRILRLPLYPDHSRSAVKRASNYLSFAASASLLGAALCGKADILWVYHPPLTSGIAAMWISAVRRGIPFVYEIQDMWPETLMATGMLPSKRIASAVGGLARCVYRRARALTVISPGFKRNLMDKGVPEEKIHVIPNWADEDVYGPRPYDEALAEAYGLSGRFNVVYGGNFGTAQAMSNVLAAARLLSEIEELQFVLIGDGVEEHALREEVARDRLRNVVFIPRQPAERMPSFFALADILLVHLRKDSLFAITVPGKTISYLASARPILCVVQGDAANIVCDARAGVSCEPENPLALAQAVRYLYELPEERRQAMGQAGRKTFLEGYTREGLVARYENLFQSIAQDDREGRN